MDILIVAVTVIVVAIPGMWGSYSREKPIMMSANVYQRACRWQ